MQVFYLLYFYLLYYFAQSKMKKKDETITSDSLVNDIDVYSVKKIFSGISFSGS